MSWIIDEFKVKPSGLFAAWRYKRVLVDNNGLITNTGVPGEPVMNLPCLNDYRKNNRRFKQDDLITEFCNLETFTNYRVYAQDCEPFAYVQTDLDSAKCGYQEPLPTPGEPPNPFGKPNYGLYKFMNDCDIDGNPIEVNFYKKEYTGDVSEIKIGSRSPVVISYSGNEEKRFGIRPCECNLSFIVDENFSLEEFYTEDEREFLVEVKQDSNIKFKGYVVPDSCAEPFLAPPYEVSIKATDGLGGLKNVIYPIPTGPKDNLRQAFLYILTYCLAQTNLDLDVTTVCNLYESKMKNGLDDDPLVQASVNPLRLSDGKGNMFNCYKVLETICNQFHAYIAQVDGSWHFVRNTEIVNQVIRRRIYNKDGFFLRGENFDPLRIAGHNKEVELINHNGEFVIGNAYKRVNVRLNFGNVPSIIFNGDFERYDGANFDFWTKYGNINVSRVQRTIKGSAGAPIDIENYALQFNETANVGKWIQADKMRVEKGDKITLNFTVGPCPTPQNLKLRIKCNELYLFNDINSENPDTYTWEPQIATVTFAVSQSTNPVTYSISMPEMKETTDMYIQLFGFTSSTSVWIDDLSINKNSTKDKLDINSNIFISSQLAFFTNSPEELQILFGDFDILKDTTVDITNPFINIPGPTFGFGDFPAIYPAVIPDNYRNPALENNMYAIYTADGSYSQFWLEYGLNNSPAPIGLALARSILKLYQKPYRIYTGDFKGNDLSYNNVFRFQVDGETRFFLKKFSIISGDFNLKFKELTNAKMIETFAKNIITNDIVIPGYDGDGDATPFIPQDPANISQNGRGIFSDQFTQEFS